MAAQLLVVGVLAACAAGPPNDSAQTMTRHPSPSLAAPAGSAEVVVLNVSGWTVIPSNQDITANGLSFVSLPRQTYATVRVAPGRHEFRFRDFPTGPRVAVLNAETGKRYYLAAGYDPSRSTLFPFAGDPVTIRLVSEVQALPLMLTMQPQQP